MNLNRILEVGKALIDMKVQLPKEVILRGHFISDIIVMLNQSNEDLINKKIQATLIETSYAAIVFAADSQGNFYHEDVTILEKELNQHIIITKDDSTDFFNIESMSEEKKQITKFELLELIRNNIKVWGFFKDAIKEKSEVKFKRLLILLGVKHSFSLNKFIDWWQQSRADKSCNEIKMVESLNVIYNILLDNEEHQVLNSLTSANKELFDSLLTKYKCPLKGNFPTFEFLMNYYLKNGLDIYLRLQRHNINI